MMLVLTSTQHSVICSNDWKTFYQPNITGANFETFRQPFLSGGSIGSIFAKTGYLYPRKPTPTRIGPYAIPMGGSGYWKTTAETDIYKLCCI